MFSQFNCFLHNEIAFASKKSKTFSTFSKTNSIPNEMYMKVVNYLSSSKAERSVSTELFCVKQPPCS